MQEFFRNISKRYIVSASSLIIAFSFAFHQRLTYEPSSDDASEVSYDENTEGDYEEKENLDDSENVTDRKGAADLRGSSNLVVSNKKPSSIKAIEEDDGPRDVLLVVGKGDTLANMLTTLGVNPTQAQHAIEAIQKVYSVKQLKIGQGIKVNVRRDPLSKEMIINGMEWRATPEQEISLNQRSGKFFAQKSTIELKRCVEGVAGRIKSSLYHAAIKQGAPSAIVKSAIQALSYEVNFQHEPKPGNGYAILYEVYKDKAGKVVKYGNLLYAAFAPGGKLREVYRFNGPNGPTVYNKQGECLARGFLRSPLDVTKLRISSGFGGRVHPIRNYTHIHKGIDYAAAHGTRVLAAANGVVTKAQYWGDFGLYVSIKHGEYTTEYAHLRKIAPGIKVGAKVHSGQFVGEVGSTGSATGAHLHFGLLKNGVHINPNSVKTMPSHKLGQKDMVQFASFKKGLDSKISARAEKGEYVLAVTDKMIS